LVRYMLNFGKQEVLLMIAALVAVCAAVYIVVKSYRQGLAGEEPKKNSDRPR